MRLRFRGVVRAAAGADVRRTRRGIQSRFGVYEKRSRGGHPIAARAIL